MKTRNRPRFGDGHTPTSSLEPCQCPSCHQDLEIVCPNRCANAAEGTMAELPAALRTRAPRTAWVPRKKGRGGAKRQTGGTRDKVLAALAAGPLTVTELSERLNDPVTVVDAMCRILWKEGAIERRFPPGRKRPMSVAPRWRARRRSVSGRRHSGERPRCVASSRS